jgi:hypothetical protein
MHLIEFTRGLFLSYRGLHWRHPKRDSLYFVSVDVQIDQFIGQINSISFRPSLPFQLWLVLLLRAVESNVAFRALI